MTGEASNGDMQAFEIRLHEGHRPRTRTRADVRWASTSNMHANGAHCRLMDLLKRSASSLAALAQWGPRGG